MEKSEQKIILLVEDEILVAIGEQTCLKDYGYDVIYAQNGEKAIEIVKSTNKIDLILMDINLGTGIDGKKAAEEILKIRNIPIVFLTSHAERETVEKIKEITRYGYVLKDSGDFVLISSIEMAFELFEAHKKTLENEERWKFALESSESGVWDWNIQTNEMFFSTQSKAMFGYEENDIDNSFYEWEKRVHPDDKEFVLKELNKHLSGETLYYQNEHRILCKDGTYKWILVKGKIISRTEKGDPLRAIGTNMDISYRKNIENELSEKNKKLENMNEEFETVIEELEEANNELEEANNELEKSETTLIEYSNRLSDILESINDAFFSVNNKLEVTYFNSASERILGKKREEVLGKRFSESFPMIKDSIFEKNFFKTIQEKVQISFEEFFDKPPYEDWYDVRMYPNKDGASVFFHITTEKKKIEDALKQTEKEKLMILSSMSEIMTYYKDKNLKIEWSNRVFAESVNLPSEELKGKYCFNLWNKTNKPCPECPVMKAFNTGQPQEIEKQAFDKKYWHIRAYPIKDENNNILGVVEIGLDITERIEREARFLSIFKAATFGIGLVINREIKEVNDAICEMTGYKREELINQNSIILYPTQEDYDYVGKEKYRQITAKGKGTVETKWKKKDGSIINIILSSSPIDTQDLSKGATFTAIDITKSKETEKELRKLLDEKNVLVREVHHRIKNNMSTIAGFLSLQTKFISDEAVKTILMDARSRIIGMMSIYDKLYRSNKFDKLSIKIYLLDLINGIETIYNIKNDKISIIKEIEDIEISSNVLFYIGIIINELIINSFKYAFPENKSGIISLFVENYMNNIVIILRDNGIGIPENINIEQSDSFGLTLIKLLVNNLEGKVEYVRENGTKVIISLPLQ